MPFTETWLNNLTLDSLQLDRFNVIKANYSALEMLLVKTADSQKQVDLRRVDESQYGSKSNILSPLGAKFNILEVWMDEFPGNNEKHIGRMLQIAVRFLQRSLNIAP